jgi:predicted CoA-binding protein
MSDKKKTLVLGASANPARYSYLAIQRLRQYGHPVKAVGLRKSVVEDVQVENAPTAAEDIDTVTLYLNPANQKQYYDYILSLNPKRIIFNPGAENDELVKLADEKGIKTMNACTLVMLGTNQY